MDLKTKQEEWEQIKEKMKSLRDSNEFIKKLSRWDKNGSHKTALNTAMDIRDILKMELDAMLKGKTYQEWQKMIDRAKKLNYRIEHAGSSIEKNKTELSKLLSE